jgi:hypothetical protein
VAEGRVRDYGEKQTPAGENGCLIQLFPGMVNEGFWPQGAKNITQKKVKGSKMAAILGERRRIRFGTSVATTTFMEKVDRANRIYFAAIREAHAVVNPGERFDLQLTCQ